ncbi:apolipoprotein N-acyltransferase [Comamonas composti]|uniref:apolipoprotein N-acyltransferase n=1 Tax=Comamonas composti TaxID=408558 RepID=UPI000A060271|nr:apolipoprotein N-acyltransferase [Comamonas composti]
MSADASFPQRASSSSFHAALVGALLVLAGLAQALSLAWPWARGQGESWLSLAGGYGRPLWWLQIASLAVLAWGLQTAGSPGRAAVRAWLFALSWLVGAFWWLFISMHVYGGLPAPLAVLAVFALAAFLASYYALAAWGFHKLHPGARGFAALLFAALWTLAELARGWLWTGFPWGAGGYAHVEGPLAVLPRWLGVYGTGFVAAVLAYVLPMLWLQRKNLRPAALAVLVLVLGLAWAGLWWVREQAVGPQDAQRPALSVELLQGNIPQDEKFEAGSGIPLALNWYGRALLDAKAQLVVAPETAIPLLPQQLPEEYLSLLRERYTRADSRQAALVGIPLGSESEGYTNSVLGWKPQAHAEQAPGDREDYRYSKHHLVPFGEFIPPLFRWFTEMMNIPLGDFNRGSLTQPSLAWAGERLAPNICYEDLFGEELAQSFGSGQSAPTVLVNVSNIGWFGNSVAIDQHLSISRMRALEFERPMLRATNTGATVVIDHEGRVVKALAPFERAVLQGQVQGRDGLTPFARWAHGFGLLPLWLACLGLVVAAWLKRGRGAAKQMHKG